MSKSFIKCPTEMSRARQIYILCMQSYYRRIKNHWLEIDVFCHFENDKYTDGKRSRTSHSVHTDSSEDLYSHFILTRTTSSHICLYSVFDWYINTSH